MANKSDTYSELLKSLDRFSKKDTGEWLQHIAEWLQEKFGFLWTGYYFVGSLPQIDSLRRIGKDEEVSGKGPWLVLGPNVGPPACEMIRYGRGVCGTAWKENRTIVVPDVDLFPGHIACSSESRSEIVIPIVLQTSPGTEVLGVIDIDSRELSAFDATDALWLEKLAAIIARELA